MGKRLILFALLAAILSSCNGVKVNKQLHDIESYISARPDSALAELRSLDTLSLRTKPARAKFSLLHAMALDKNYIDTTDLNVIAPAVSFYENHGSVDDRMKTYFYLGRIYENAGDWYSAMNALTVADDISARSNDNDFKCLICNKLGSIYSRNGNHKRDLYYSEKAKEYAELASNEFNAWIMQGSIAGAYANLRQWELSDSLYTVFLSQPILDTNRYAGIELLASQVAARKNPPEPAKSIQLYKDAISLGKRPNVSNLSVLAYAYELLGQTKESDRIMSAVYSFLGDKKNSSVDLWKYRIDKNRGNYESALLNFESTIQAQDSLLVAALEESLDKVQKDYYAEKSDRFAAEKKAQAASSGLIILVITILCTVLLIMFLRYKKRWIQQLEGAESLRNDFARLLLEDNDKDRALRDLRKQYNSVFKEQFKALDDLCAAYWSPMKGNKKKLIYAASSRAIDLIKNDARLEETIDKYMDGVMSKLRTDLSDHKEKDFKLIALFIIGFSGKTIASIMDIAVGTVYTYKNKIKQEINNLDSPNKALYLELIG